MRYTRNLFGQTLHQSVVDLRRVDPSHTGVRGVFDPDLARLVDHDLGHRVALEPAFEWRKIGIQIDAALAHRGKAVGGVIGQIDRLFAAAVADRMDIRAHDSQFETALKSSGRAVKTRIGCPIGTRIVGGR